VVSCAQDKHPVRAPATQRSAGKAHTDCSITTEPSALQTSGAKALSTIVDILFFCNAAERAAVHLLEGNAFFKAFWHPVFYTLQLAGQEHCCGAHKQARTSEKRVDSNESHEHRQVQGGPKSFPPGMVTPGLLFVFTVCMNIDSSLSASVLQTGRFIN
jgi:hypothetical protein